MHFESDTNTTIDIERDELDLSGEVIALMQMLKSLNTDLVVGLKLLESDEARDHVTGASAEREAQREQLLQRAQKQRDLLATLRAQLGEAVEN